MAPVIWGLDLKEMQWGKFKGKYMFNDVYHLRKTKMIVYQIAMILCVCSESVGTAALSDYVDQRDGITTRYGYHTSVRDIVGIFSFNIFVGIAVATIFGSGFFFDLFWPQRAETSAVKKAWKICSVLMCIFTLADAIALTVIVATQRATIDGLSNSEAQKYFDLNGPPAPIYRKNAYCVASTVLLWLGMLGTFASTYIMWKSIAHDKIHGPFAAGRGPADDPWDISNRPGATQPSVADPNSDVTFEPKPMPSEDTPPSSAGIQTGHTADPERGAAMNPHTVPRTTPAANAEPYPGT
ncbi:hypothetical protein MFRU_017g00490 [Monilinia fructicola]|uniref:Uncharacterized protein n=1 Tax=Monilinia fructicola TaxID=38448 RepID=A0A5M9JH38_MONFR|nr:hypothetical protein EYC84_007837 [Monilinia fructicola]KAG4029112.1 hypothetical protein MFRU_017g00490 [Monilinia fructicola]